MCCWVQQLDVRNESWFWFDGEQGRTIDISGASTKGKRLEGSFNLY